MSSADSPLVGLRERKKARTRASIQQHALRLFRERGYEATTIEQICEAAEVSQSTFFRYFPTKEDLAMYDATDPVVLGALRAQPRRLGPVAALRGALRDGFSALPADEMERQLERFELVRSVPELRARMLEEFIRTIDVTAAALAERCGRRPDDPTLRHLSGAMLGVLMAAVLDAGELSSEELVRRMDEALAHLETGFAL